MSAETTEYVVALKTDNDNKKLLVVNGKWGVTTCPLFYSLRYGDLINVEAKTFPTKEQATEFIEDWDIHPHYASEESTGEYEVIEVKKMYRKVLKGYLPKDVNVSQP